MNADIAQTSIVKARFPGSANECTDASPSTPERVMNEPYSTSAYAISVMPMFVLMRPPVLRCVSIVCTAPTVTSHGSKLAFSTGSHAQKPPQPSVSYAQKPPSMTPKPSTIAAPSVHGNDVTTHP